MEPWTVVDLFDELGSLLRHMPRARSGKYVAPGETDLEAFRAWVAALAAGNEAGPEHEEPGLGYELLRITDRGDHSQPSLLLREPAPPGRAPYARGWGMYLLRPKHEKNLMIEVPHPLHDEGTGQLGLALYRQLSARALLLAGAHRHANPHGEADPAHNPQTIFHAVHQALLAEGHPVVLQLHGFSARKHPDYPQVIVGGATDSPQALLERLAEACSAAGIPVGLCKDHRWRKLCGRTNVQAAATTGGVFIHLELSEALRQKGSPILAVFQAALGS